MRGRFRANNAEAVRRAALNGLGIALLSHLTAQDDIREGRLKLLMPDFPPLRFALSVVYPSRRNLPARTRIVIDFLTEVLRADPAMALADETCAQPTSGKSRHPAIKLFGKKIE